MTVIRPGGGLQLDLGELIRERELLLILAGRSLRARYKQSVAGFGWAVLQPVLGMVVFTFVFGRLAELPTAGLPPAVFYLSGLTLWTYVANTLAGGANSLVEHQALITKVYFPRIYLPLSVAAAGLVDLAIATTVTLILAAVLGVLPGLHLLFVPLPVGIAVIGASGVSLSLASLNARYRDVRFGISYLTQLWLFGSPVAYSASLVPADYRPFFGLNPMAGAIEGFRWALTGQGPAPVSLMLVSAAAALVLFVLGLVQFQRLEATFADVI